MQPPHPSITALTADATTTILLAFAALIPLVTVTFLMLRERRRHTDREDIV